MTHSELLALFQRGRAEIAGRGATTPAAFAAAIIRRGVDSSIVEFRRCKLMRTTSENTFESQLVAVLPIRQRVDRALAEAIRVAVAVRDALPADRKEGTRWKFAGLRGPLEEALVDLAAAETDEQREERSWALVDTMFAALSKVDRNRAHRSRKMRFELLPAGWAARLFTLTPATREARLALGLCSLKRHGDAIPEFLAHRLGVTGQGKFWSLPEIVPAQRVWSGADVVSGLCAVCERRLVDATVADHDTQNPPFESWIAVDISDIDSWLAGDVDSALLQLWIDRLSLFQWTTQSAAALHPLLAATRPAAIDGPLALYALFRPLFDGALFKRIGRTAGLKLEPVAPAKLASIVATFRRGDISRALDIARAAYHSAGIALAEFAAPFGFSEPRRLLASLIFPGRASQIIPIFERWLAPTKLQPEQQYA